MSTVFIYSGPSISASSATTDSTNQRSKLLKIIKIQEIFKKQNLDLLWTSNYLHSIYIVYTMIDTVLDIIMGFPDSSAGKESPCNARDLGWIPGLGRSPGDGKAYPLQYFGLENSMDRIVYGVAKSRTRLISFHFHIFILLHQVLVTAFGTFIASCGIFLCGEWIL